MNDDDKKDVEIKITQDKLVDLLLHAATREDIAKLDNKIDALEARITNSMDALEAKINNSMVTLEARITNSMDALEVRLTTNANNSEARVNSQFKWILGTTLGVGVSLIGVMIGLASFLTHYLH